MSFYDIFAVIFLASVLILAWLFIVLFCSGFYDRKKDRQDNSKKGGMRL